MLYHSKCQFSCPLYYVLYIFLSFYYSHFNRNTCTSAYLRNYSNSRADTSQELWIMFASQNVILVTLLLSFPDKLVWICQDLLFSWNFHYKSLWSLNWMLWKLKKHPVSSRSVHGNTLFIREVMVFTPDATVCPWHNLHSLYANTN